MVYAGNIDLDSPLIWTVAEVLSTAECDALIDRIESDAPVAASINDGSPNGVMRPEVRNNDRLIIDEPELAAKLFERVVDHLPARLLGMEICGANERLRCYRYRPGQFFGLHSDGSFRRNEHERSLLTFMIYLNGGCEGGETDFPQLGQTIEPAAGLALFFQHPVLHEGCPVRAGVKYAIRSDIMYRKLD